MKRLVSILEDGDGGITCPLAEWVTGDGWVRLYPMRYSNGFIYMLEAEKNLFNLFYV